jgi:hypothetical protein
MKVVIEAHHANLSHPLDPFQLFAAIFGLGVLLAVMVLADEVFQQ